MSEDRRTHPIAIYNRGDETITCPHCGRALPLDAWILIETGYERYWCLSRTEDDDAEGVPVASGNDFSDDGVGPVLLEHDSNDCEKRSRVPDDFEWDWGMDRRRLLPAAG